MNFLENLDFAEESFLPTFQNIPLNQFELPLSEMVKMDVLLVYGDNPEREFIPSMIAEILPNGDLNLNSLIQSLKNEGLPVENALIYYFSKMNDAFYYCGRDPLPIEFLVPGSEILQGAQNRIITLKIRPCAMPQSPKQGSEGEEMNCVVEEPTTLCHSSDQENFSIREEDTTDNSPSPSTYKSFRKKGRIIGEVLELVQAWRKLYAGFVDSTTGQVIKLNLHEAASRLGVPKKSLDDYLIMIKHAQNAGFDFIKHKNERFGILRSFVKKHSQSGSTKGQLVSISRLEGEETSVSKCSQSKKIRRENLF